MPRDLQTPLVERIDAKTRRANLRLLIAMGIFALVLSAVVLIWKFSLPH